MMEQEMKQKEAEVREHQQSGTSGTVEQAREIKRLRQELKLMEVTEYN